MNDSSVTSNIETLWATVQDLQSQIDDMKAGRTPAPEAASADEQFVAADAGVSVESVREAFAEPAATPSDAVTRAINSWFDDATEDHKKRMTAALRTFARSYQVTRFRIEQSLPLHVQRHDPEYSVRVHDLTMHALLPEVPRG